MLINKNIGVVGIVRTFRDVISQPSNTTRSKSIITNNKKNKYKNRKNKYKFFIHITNLLIIFLKKGMTFFVIPPQLRIILEKSVYNPWNKFDSNHNRHNANTDRQ